MSNASALIICIVVMQRCMETSSNYTNADIRNVTESGAENISRNACENVFGTRTNTTLRLAKLREKLRSTNTSAYIILSTDDHQSEFVSDRDKRRAFLTGFTGSSGDAVVTLDSAALWTDSRYYIQAESQIDSNWRLMKTGEETTPTITKWLGNQLQPGQAVSTDPRICTCEKWKKWSDELEKLNITMKPLTENLVDQVWEEIEERPSYPDAPITILDVEFSGLTWQDKLRILREDMTNEKVDALVLTALDEIAWTLNLRGGEIPYTPLFRSYLLIEMTRATLYVPPSKITRQILDHLNAERSGSGDSVQISDYGNIWQDIEEIGLKSRKVGLPTSYSYAGGISYLICQAIPPEKRVPLISPALLRKNVKNAIEAAGMRASHARDAVAVCELLMTLERDIANGTTPWTELKAARALDDLRAVQQLNVGPSFGTISAFGKHTSMPHYEPQPETDISIDQTQLYMIDSGGQYLDLTQSMPFWKTHRCRTMNPSRKRTLTKRSYMIDSDGTTDVTRTVHFGNPRQIEREIYTRLLMGCINIASVVFKNGYTLQQLEILVRQPLFELGLDYGHGTTHGIGSFLSVHEAFNLTYNTNFFGSQEPGYYKENEFGMRLENIITVVKANISENENSHFLTFDTVTLVPYEKKLIAVEMLEQRHLNWLNYYHKTVRDVVGSEMLRQGRKELYQWLVRKTEPIYMKYK